MGNGCAMRAGGVVLVVATRQRGRALYDPPAVGRDAQLSKAMSLRARWDS